MNQNIFLVNCIIFHDRYGNPLDKFNIQNCSLSLSIDITMEIFMDMGNNVEDYVHNTELIDPPSRRDILVKVDDDIEYVRYTHMGTVEFIRRFDIERGARQTDIYAYLCC